MTSSVENMRVHPGSSPATQGRWRTQHDGEGMTKPGAPSTMLRMVPFLCLAEAEPARPFRVWL